MGDGAENNIHMNDGKEITPEEAEINLQHNLLLAELTLTANIIGACEEKKLLTEQQFLKSMTEMDEEAEKLMRKKDDLKKDLMQYMLMTRNLLDQLEKHGIDREAIMEKTQQDLKKLNPAYDFEKLAKEEAEKTNAYIR